MFDEVVSSGDAEVAQCDYWSGEVKQVIAVYTLSLHYFHRPILIINGNLYYVPINFCARCLSLSILALYVVGALTSFVGGNSSGDVALLVYCCVTETFEHVTVAIVLKNTILEQLLLSMLFRVKSHASRLEHLILAPLFSLLVEELPFQIFAALLRQ